MSDNLSDNEEKSEPQQSLGAVGSLDDSSHPDKGYRDIILDVFANTSCVIVNFRFIYSISFPFFRYL